MATAHTPVAAKCQIAEFVQYICDLQPASGCDAQPQVHCFPVPRIFRICQNRPAVEITPFVSINMGTGEVNVPPESSLQLPEVRPWRDVFRYPKED